MLVPFVRAQRVSPLALAVRLDQSSAAVLTGPVVHVVGCITDEVFSFLGPAAQALARAGREQTVVTFDDRRRSHHLSRLALCSGLRLVAPSRNPIAQWLAVSKVCKELVAVNPPQAMHLHGVLPCLVGAWTLRKSARAVAIFYSPHASRSIGALNSVGAFAMLLIRVLMGPSRRAAIVNSANEASLFKDWNSSELLESPVSEGFLEVQSHEARRPLIVSSGKLPSPRNAELFSRLAVLLGGKELGISFNWIGPVNEILRARFEAAGVRVYDPQNDVNHGLRLAGAWIYVAPRANRGFPIGLVQAMAAGLPCVALDCLEHRAVIRNGETGYLCATESDIIDRVVMLIDSPSLRHLCGKAARAEAKLRFDECKFGERLIDFYSLTTGAAPHNGPSPR